MKFLERIKKIVPALSFGAAPIADLYTTIPEPQAIETIQLAFEQGLNLIDTSPYYGLGLSEKRIGLALQGIPREQFIISSKVGHDITTPNGYDFSRDGVLKSIEGSLERLKLDYLDIVHLHDPDNHEYEALEIAFPTLVKLRDQGVIRAIGAGMNQWQMLERFLTYADFDCFLLAGRYTLLEQQSLKFLNACADKNVAVLLAGVFNSGILATGAIANAKFQYENASPEIICKVNSIQQICNQFGVELKAAALQFAMQHPAVSTTVIGVQSKQEILENIVASSTPIPYQLWTALKLEGLIALEVPVQ
jgi:D-threo-aldose 1-dehydrogenase